MVKFINACTAYVMVIWLFSCGLSVYGRDVFSDENVQRHNSLSSDNQNGTSNGNGNVAVDSASDSFQWNSLKNAPFSASLDEHFKKIQQTFSLLDLRPKDACSRRRDIHMFYCPTPNPRNFRDWSCIRIDELCNGFPECPGAEDEDPILCMYWLAGQEQLRVLKKIIVAHYQIDAELSPASRPFEYN